jgi:serine/threonine-protein kinase RsbW
VATVTVSFTPLPAHVRTARFIAASVARRAGVAESILDEIRLAVSEACSVAVRFHLAHAPAAPVELRLTETTDTFSVQVVDAVNRLAPDRDDDVTFDLTDDEVGRAASFGGNHILGGSGSASGMPAAGVNGNGRDGGAVSALHTDDLLGVVDLRGHERIGLAVISGLVDDVTVEYLAGGSVVTMTWPIVQEPALGARSSGANPL